MTPRPVEAEAWELEVGFAINDADAWMKNCRFGVKEEYKSKVVATTGSEETGQMFLCDLVDAIGEVLATQGWSIGTGWVISEDGLTITHAKRKNVVHSSRYGELQARVLKELKVPMQEFGSPTEAGSWEGLGFHWMTEQHATVAGVVKAGIMPTVYLGKLEETQVEAAKEKQPAPEALSLLEQEIVKVASSSKTAKEFQLKVVKMPNVAKDDRLMADCLNDGPDGFYARHKK